MNANVYVVNTGQIQVENKPRSFFFEVLKNLPFFSDTFQYSLL